MGCAPSITVSQSGVVYCRDTDENNSPRDSSINQQQHIHIHTANADVTAEAGTSHNAETTTVIYHNRKEKGKISIEVETQTSSSKSSSLNIMKGIVNEVKLGKMKLSQPPMQVLLVFPKKDSQCDGFQTACEKGGYKCMLVRNVADALERYLEVQHDVVIIDHRNPKGIDALGLCRSLRATKPGEYTVILAVTKKSSNPAKEEPSVLPLLNAGFSRKYQESTGVSNCLNELNQLELGQVRSNFKLRATNCLFSAMDHSSDAIEITNENHDIQYINQAHENLTGFTVDDTLGRETEDSPKSEKNKPELMESIFTQLKKGKPWEGLLYCKKKNGDSLPQNVHITPVFGYGGKVCHYVYHRRDPSPAQTISTSVFNQEIQHLEKIDEDIHTGSGTLIRRQSVARIHSMTIEAPITKVINIINAAQENSPVTVVQALDTVLEILRGSELYSPQLSSQQVREEDKVTSDLVGGLMSHTHFHKRRPSGPECAGSKNLSHHSPATPPTHLSQAPLEVQKVLADDHRWDFSILQLERLTNHRPLTYLGLKIFSRFNVSSFLGVSEDVLRNWLQVIESNYHSSNPYHNSTHAADVLQATAYFLQKDRLKNCFEQSDQVASLIAAIVHDVDHPGKTNSFLCNAGSDLAILYNDTAVLESHHSALAFQVTTRDDSCNIFKELDREDYRAIRHSVIDMVLATEMTRHFEHLSKFVNCVNKPGTRDGDDCSSLQSGHSTPDTAALSTPENRALVRRMLIKCADVANPTRPRDLCAAWAQRISQEYFNQTDEEKRRGLPVVMPIFDRSSCSIPKSQISFIDYFITDMFDAWDAFSDTPELIEHLHINYRYWKEEEEKLNKKKLSDGEKSSST